MAETGISLIIDGELSRVREIGRISSISLFPKFNTPYNDMIEKGIPAIANPYVIEYETLDEPLELISMTVTCSGYGKGGKADYYRMWVNDELWFNRWYTNEVKEGLFVGTSTFVYSIPPMTKFKIEFNNETGTSKTLWVGFRFLRDKKD